MGNPSLTRETKVNSHPVSLLLVTVCGQIGSHTAAFPEPELYRLLPGELVLAASEGGYTVHPNGRKLFRAG